jgi:predicted neutral ceramidase superfamily lipid hydrolase
VKYFWTLLWTFLLVLMLNYVAGAMIGVGLDLAQSAILAVVSTIILLVFPAVLPNGSEENHSH